MVTPQKIVDRLQTLIIEVVKVTGGGGGRVIGLKDNGVLLVYNQSYVTSVSVPSSFQ